MSRPSRSQVRDALIGLAVVLFVLSPNVLTHNGFGLDTSNHAWLIWIQGLSIAHTGHPSLFLSAGGGGAYGPDLTGAGLFEPYFAFYGGTLYALAGALSALLGQRPQVAYVLSSGLFIAMAYRGVWLLARQAGVRAFVAHLPALIFVTSAYYVTDLFARGAWPEFAALSALPFVLAYGLRLLREPWTVRPVALFAFGAVILTGSHNISLLWSSIIVLVVGFIAWVAMGKGRPQLRRVRNLFGLFVLSTAVNAWFLLGDVLRSGKVMVTAGSGLDWDQTKSFDPLINTVNLFRVTPKDSGTYGLAVTAPVLAVLFAILLMVVGQLSVPAAPKFVRRLWWVLAIGVVALVGMMTMHAGGWDFLGAPFTRIQFPYRLAGWVALGSALLLALALAVVGSPPRGTRAWIVGLGVVLLALTLIQSAEQMYPKSPTGFWPRPRSDTWTTGDRSLPPTWYDLGSYRDRSATLVSTVPGRYVNLPLPHPGTTHVSATVNAPPGEDPIATNIAAGPYAVKVTAKGASVVGRNDNGFVVIKRNPGYNGPVTITADAHGGLLQTLAGLISILALIGLLALILVLALRGRRERRRSASAPDEAAPAVVSA
jgi:hypothetical protein